MSVIVLILFTIINGDVYKSVQQMPSNASRADCVTAGATWISGQKPEDNPQYYCAELHVNTPTGPTT